MTDHRPAPHIFPSRNARPDQPETGGKIAVAGAIGALTATAIFVAATIILGGDAASRPAGCLGLTSAECAAAVETA